MQNIPRGLPCAEYGSWERGLNPHIYVHQALVQGEHSLILYNPI